MKKIGILGSGAVGKALAEGFRNLGNEVMIATRNADKLADWQIEHGNVVKVGTFEETADFGELLVLAVKGTAAINLVAEIAHFMKGKTVLDATNPIAENGPEKGVLHFFTNLDRSLMEDLQEKAPETNFVKAFNSIGSAHMVNPKFSETPSMFICGNSSSAKKDAGEIIERFGFEVEDMGEAEAARAIEPLCMLWCIPGFRNNNWNHAFKLLK